MYVAVPAPSHGPIQDKGCERIWCGVPITGYSELQSDLELDFDWLPQAGVL